MHLIDDVDPVCSLSRRILNLLTNLTDVLNTIVRCRINFHHIHGTSRCNGLAGRAFVAWASVHRMLTVNRFGKDLCNGSLAGSAGAAKQIRMSDTSAGNLVFQSLHDMILALDIVKFHRAPFAVQCSV